MTLRRARESARRSGSPDRTTWVIAAALRYWLGQWDDALAELSSDEDDAPGLTYTFLRERWPALLVHGVGALIAGRRDERTTADQHLRAGLALPVQTVPDRENRDFLVAAHAVALEQRGERRQAVQVLAALVPRGEDEMTLTHQWLPDLVRLAIAAGDRRIARTAARACQEEATAETQPARAAAASLRCQGLLKSDPVPLRDAVAHYRTVGPAVELPAALEDLAAVVAERGRQEEARAALNEAVSLYEGLNARWNIRRADSRLRPYGIRRGVRGPRGQRATSGWAALTPTEIKIAALVARGDSTSEIARGMFFPGAPYRPTSRTSWPSSAPEAGWRSSAKHCDTRSPPSRRLCRYRRQILARTAGPRVCWTLTRATGLPDGAVRLGQADGNAA